MTILLYHRESSATPAERAAVDALSAQGGKILYRNAQAFLRREVEDADLVVTDSDRVREAYEKAGTKVVPLLSGTESASDNAGDPRYRIEPRGGGWYDVVGPDGPVNDSAMRKDEAEELLSTM